MARQVEDAAGENDSDTDFSADMDIASELQSDDKPRVLDIDAPDELVSSPDPNPAADHPTENK